jgi:hypothetical protein
MGRSHGVFAACRIRMPKSGLVVATLFAAVSCAQAPAPMSGPPAVPPPDAAPRTPREPWEAVVFDRRPMFEPSAVARIGDSDRFLVLNDKSGIAAATVYKLVCPPGSAPQLREELSFDVDAEKLEGVTASARESGVFYATTSFDRPGEGTNRLVKITLDQQARLASQEVLPLYHPGEAVRKQLGLAWSKVEALALSPEEDRLLFGVRAAGPDFMSPSFRVTVLSYRIDALTEEPELVLNIDLSPDTILGRPEGISSLEYVDGLGSYLLLTSFEDPRDVPAVEQTGAHLWVIPGDLAAVSAPEAWRDLPRRELHRKAEGVAAVSRDGLKALIVFDDDAARKSDAGEEGKFKLAPNEAVFSVVDVPRRPSE